MTDQIKPDKISRQANYSVPPRFVIYNERANSKHNEHRVEAGTTKEHNDIWPKWNAIATTAATIGIMCVGIYQWRALNSTDHAIHGQLKVMETQSAIQQFDLRAVMEVSLVRKVESGEFNITPILTNVGKSDAINVRGWTAFKYFNPRSDMAKETFLDKPPDQQMTGPTTFIHGDSTALETEVMTAQQAVETADRKGLGVSYGHIEYSDIFKTIFTIDYCRGINFVRDPNGAINWSLPVVLRQSCERRTEKKANPESE